VVRIQAKRRVRPQVRLIARIVVCEMEEGGGEGNVGDGVGRVGEEVRVVVLVKEEEEEAVMVLEGN